jgi:hypothetical protein
MVVELSPAALATAFAANFGVGAIWYGVLAKPWMREVGLTREQIRSEKWPMPPYLVTVVGAAVQTFVFALLIAWTRPPGPGESLLVGALVGLLAAFATGKHHAFGRKSWALFAIDGGNDLAGFLAMGLVFGLMRP